MLSDFVVREPAKERQRQQLALQRRKLVRAPYSATGLRGAQQVLRIVARRRLSFVGERIVIGQRLGAVAAAQKVDGAAAAYA